MNILTNDHFLLGLGLASGPAIIICFAIYAFFRWGKKWKTLINPCNPGNPDCKEHAGLVKDIAFTAKECLAIWGEIKDINHRQMSLRERLPQEYVSKDDLKEIQERLKGIDGKLDRFFELSVLKNHN